MIGTPVKERCHAVFGVMVFIVFFAATADAFTFDAWKSGMKENGVVEAGKNKGITVEFDAGGFAFFGDKKPEKLAVKVAYAANTKLMGYDAKLNFSFTPESRLLHSLRVSIALPMSSDKADMEVLADSIAKQLDSKYKEHGVPTVDSYIGQIVDKMRSVGRRSWAGKGDTVTMESNWKMVGGDVVIVYEDDRLNETAKTEDRRIREKRLDQSSGGDKSKF
jgi:hypothetical protein